jgi:hypothetical protein
MIPQFHFRRTGVSKVKRLFCPRNRFTPDLPWWLPNLNAAIAVANLPSPSRLTPRRTATRSEPSGKSSAAVNVRAQSSQTGCGWVTTGVAGLCLFSRYLTSINFQV